MRAYYHSNNKKKNDEKKVVWIDEYILNWIDASDREDALRIVCGGPGSGKSSFLKILAGKLAENKPDLSIMYIPLHLYDFHNNEKILSSVSDIVKEEFGIDYDIFQMGKKTLL